MRLIPLFKTFAAAAVFIVLAGCATQAPFDYTAYKQSRPRSLLVLPPLNNSPEVQASSSVLAQATFPLAEGGYYVLPVTLVAETFKENGMPLPPDMHATPIDKLREIFGADAVLYITIDRYGTAYRVVQSATVVSAQARLVDLKTGQQLWAGSATASSDEGQNQGSGGLVGLLVTALVKQVLASALDQNHKVAGVAAARLLSPGTPNGLLYGPRSPRYVKD
ncbi:MAG: hypothetical protein CVU30_05255 [Betaproteobacteria bacterium HGW-Betaproteobacteria-3]|jgi:hypothetical protein|nr:MAG: hypothetical protein CVU30_05255 [Betaproteobacteria bacterium HGW-Betaproteobacteria-3]